MVFVLFNNIGALNCFIQHCLNFWS
jgi:hypothetical protein